MPFVPLIQEEEEKMLKVLGVKKFNDLLKPIPDKFLLKDDLNLENGKTEYEVKRYVEKLAAKNLDFTKAINFMGGGVYDHFIPAALDHLLLRSEFYTAYTPYQAEVSQGTLQAIYEYQSLIAELTQMDIANASMYDGGTALAEAILTAIRKKKKADNVVLYSTVHPYYLDIVKTYLKGSNIDIRLVKHDNYVVDSDEFLDQIDKGTAAVVVQTPNFYGFLEDVFEIGDFLKDEKIYFISVNNPISLAILEAPGNYGADIALGEAQSLGNGVNYGGPLIGFFAVKNKLKRDFPGRVVGATTDKKGNVGYVLTLQTREQHIRRAKATSNICSNEGLCALATTIYLSLVGKEGFRKVAEVSYKNANYAYDKIKELKGYEALNDKPIFNEFAIKTPVKAEKIIKDLYSKNILAGINLGWFNSSEDNMLLLAFTEKRTKEEIDILITELSNYKE